MVELPIDFVRAGDVLAKNHTFKKYSGGMSSTVDLMKGYTLSERVLEKLQKEFRAQFLCIADPTDRFSDLPFEEGIDESARSRIVERFQESVRNIQTSRIVDLKQLEWVVRDIIENVSGAIRNGKGSFRTLSRTFNEVQSHDIYTWEHSVNAAIYAAIIALSIPSVLEENRKLVSPSTLSKAEILVFNMLLHDVGKIRIPVEVLNKEKELTQKEEELIRRHPYGGFAYLRKVNEELHSNKMVPIPSYFMKACLLHHQAYDGTGYPALRAVGADGGRDVRPLRGEEISPVGRIAAVADMYDALSSNRPYRLPYHPADALRILRREKNRKLDPRIVEILVDRIRPFPQGSTVVLTTGELAVVTGFFNDNAFQPIVRPYLRKVWKDGKERIIRLANRAPIAITAGSRVRIALNKNLYHVSPNGAQEG